MKNKDMTPEAIERKKAYQRSYYAAHKNDLKKDPPPAEAVSAARLGSGQPPPGDPGPRPDQTQPLTFAAEEWRDFLKGAYEQLNVLTKPGALQASREVHIHPPPSPDIAKDIEKLERALQEIHADLKEIVTLLKYQVTKSGGMVINSGRK